MTASNGFTCSLECPLPPETALGTLCNSLVGALPRVCSIFLNHGASRSVIFTTLIPILPNTFIYTGELNSCGLRVLHPEMTTEALWINKNNSLGYLATRTFDHSLLAQELPSVALQESGVLDPRFSL